MDNRMKETQARYTGSILSMHDTMNTRCCPTYQFLKGTAMSRINEGSLGESNKKQWDKWPFLSIISRYNTSHFGELLSAQLTNSTKSKENTEQCAIILIICNQLMFIELNSQYVKTVTYRLATQIHVGLGLRKYNRRIVDKACHQIQT